MDKISELGVELVKLDMTALDQIHIKELARSDRSNIPVNIIYPADYPKRPAILLEEFIWAADALEALDRISPDTVGSERTRVSHPESGGDHVKLR